MLTGSRVARPLRQRRVRPRFWLLDFYGSAIGKKAVMAVTGIVLLGFVLTHMLGNLHLYQDAAHMNHYGEYLRTIGEPILPHTGFLWILARRADPGVCPAHSFGSDAHHAEPRVAEGRI